MQTTTTNLLSEKLRELALYEPVPLPVLSLYLNTQADSTGHPHFEAFLRKEFKTRAANYESRSVQRESFDRDCDKILAWLENELQASSDGVAIFACCGDGDFFEAVQLDAPVESHEFHVAQQPSLYTLALLNDQYPPYAAVLADTNSARIFVFGLAGILDEEVVSNTKVSASQVGGWSQARYQRRVENFHVQHTKEVMEHLDKLVLESGIQHFIFAGDAVILPLLRDQLSPAMAGKVVAELSLNIKTPEHDILKATLATMREYDAKMDQEEAVAMMDAVKAGGLAAGGAVDVLAALENGQVDSLFISTALNQFHLDGEMIETLVTPVLLEGEALMNRGVPVAETLITRAHQTGARVRFVEDASLLVPVGGVGATLRYRLDSGESHV